MNAVEAMELAAKAATKYKEEDGELAVQHLVDSALEEVRFAASQGETSCETGVLHQTVGNDWAMRVARDRLYRMGYRFYDYDLAAGTVICWGEGLSRFFPFSCPEPLTVAENRAAVIFGVVLFALIICCA